MRTRRQTRLLQSEGSGGEQDGKPSHINFESDDPKTISKAVNKSPVQEENDGSVNSTNGGPPQRKKRILRRNSILSKGKTHNRIKGKLSGIFALPVELFMEIIQYLPLPDVLSLSRLNKLFHGILMTRSVATLNAWRAAANNVPGLPPCPEDLCEPQYATLIYSKHCTMCGAGVVRPMDPYLNIRLCKDCTEKQYVSTARSIEPPRKTESSSVTYVNEIDKAFRILLHKSTITRLAGNLDEVATCLIRDKEELKKWRDDIRFAVQTGVMSVQEVNSKIDQRWAATRARRMVRSTCCSSLSLTEAP
ncbi:unnamed protein product [Rhizoctonia solani]|uniref:F-box domain-containing protein n=1 Tax=Rhizoctonia solani TaxID=456999 RepID=A0A8H3HZ62_9AGAM|nr:unnamed protein product [Rhizoctonia solani]